MDNLLIVFVPLPWPTVASLDEKRRVLSINKEWADTASFFAVQAVIAHEIEHLKLYPER